MFDDGTTKEAWATPDEWAKVDAKAVASGSRSQAANVLEMALQDLIWAQRQIEAAGIRFKRRSGSDPIRFRT